MGVQWEEAWGWGRRGGPERLAKEKRYSDEQEEFKDKIGGLKTGAGVQYRVQG